MAVIWKQRCGAILLGVILGMGNGCDRLSSGPGAEQREANYISGQNFAMQGQKEKAIASFEQAVLVNPSNAAAHLALGDLFYDQLEFINAAYHYSRYLQLLERRGQKPDISAVDNLRNCEMQLAVKFSRELSRQQNDFEIEALRRQIAEKDNLIQRLQAEVLQRSPSTNLTSVSTVNSFTSPNVPTTGPLRSNSTPEPSANQLPLSTETVRPPPERPRPAPSPPRTHVVRAGETPAAIARKYRVNVKSLLAANPGLSPTRMRVGSVLRLPTP